MTWFRVAPEASTRQNVVTTLGQTAVFWFVFLWLLPALLVRISRALALPPIGIAAAGATPAAIALFTIASALGLTTGWCMAALGRGTPLPLRTARELVTAGPYRWVRNPMALAGIAQGFAVGLWRDDVLVAHCALLGAWLWHVGVRGFEEADLEARFGAPFRAYRGRVPLWVPRFLSRPVEGILGAASAAAAIGLLAANLHAGADLIARSPFIVLAALLAGVWLRRTFRPQP